MFDRSGLTFVPNVPVRVTSVVGERTYAALTEFFNPFLWVIMECSRHNEIRRVFSFEGIVSRRHTVHSNGRFTNAIGISMTSTKLWCSWLKKKRKNRLVIYRSAAFTVWNLLWFQSFWPFRLKSSGWREWQSLFSYTEWSNGLYRRTYDPRTMCTSFFSLSLFLGTSLSMHSRFSV